MIICCMVAWPDMSLRNAVPRIKKTTPLRKLFGVPATDSNGLVWLGKYRGNHGRIHRKPWIPDDCPMEPIRDLQNPKNRAVNRQQSPSCHGDVKFC